MIHFSMTTINHEGENKDLRFDWEFSIFLKFKLISWLQKNLNN